MLSPRLRTGELFSTSWRVSIYINYLNSPEWKICLFFHIYLILYTYIWIYGYSFYTSGYYSLKCLAIGSSFSWLLYPFGIHPSFYVCVFEHFLTFWQYMKLLAHLIYFCPKCYNHPKNGIRKPGLGTRCAFAN